MRYFANFLIFPTGSTLNTDPESPKTSMKAADPEESPAPKSIKLVG